MYPVNIKNDGQPSSGLREILITDIHLSWPPYIYKHTHLIMWTLTPSLPLVTIIQLEIINSQQWELFMYHTIYVQLWLENSGFSLTLTKLQKK